MNLTHQQLEKLYLQAKRGDMKAESKLRQYNRQISLKANTRLKNLEDADLAHYSYDVAVSYTDSEYGGFRYRYDYISLPTVSSVYQNIRSAKRFLESKTSTIRGQKEISKNTLTFFREKGLNIPHNKKAEQAFLQFLSDGDTLDVLKRSYGSNETFGRIADMLAPRNTRTERLNELAQAAAKGVTEAESVLSKYENN